MYVVRHNLEYILVATLMVLATIAGIAARLPPLIHRRAALDLGSDRHTSPWHQGAVGPDKWVMTKAS